MVPVIRRDNGQPFFLESHCYRGYCPMGETIPTPLQPSFRLSDRWRNIAITLIDPLSFTLLGPAHLEHPSHSSRVALDMLHLQRNICFWPERATSTQHNFTARAKRARPRQRPT